MESPVEIRIDVGQLQSSVRVECSEKDAVEWAGQMEMGDTMFAVVNTYTRAAQWNELSAESSFRLSGSAGIYWGC